MYSIISCSQVIFKKMLEKSTVYRQMINRHTLEKTEIRKVHHNLNYMYKLKKSNYKTKFLS